MSRMNEQCFCLRWNNYQSSVVCDLRSLLEQEEFVDVTIACEGRRLKAHRLMLSACSNYFRNLLRENPSDHPIIFLRDVKFWELESIMDFIYNGQVNVMQEHLPGFIRTAEALQIKGLAAVNNNNIHPPKMLGLKHLHDMLLKQQEVTKEPSKHHPPYSDLNSDNNAAVKHIPPLVHPAKRIRYENDHHNSAPTSYKEVYVEKSQNSNGNSPNVDSENHKDANRKESSPSESNDTHRPLVLHPSSEKPFYRETEDMNDAKISDRLSPSHMKVEQKSSTENTNSSRSGTPDEERTELEEDRISHDGSLPPFELDWGNLDQQAPLNFGVNDAGLPICKVCGKVFKHQGSLVAHYQVHQQRTKCPVCKKVLSRHYHMKVHLLTVHKVPDAEIEGLLRSQNIA